MKKWSWIIGLLLISVILLSGCTLQGRTSVQGTTLTSAQQIEVPSAITGLEELLESIYDVVNPSVVNISVTQNITSVFGDSTTLPFNTGLASGFVWDTEGHIVTNNHVIENADSINVTFYDGTVAKATLVGADPDSDLAVIRVETDDIELRPVTVGDSSKIKVGQLTVAIGNPFGYQNTMTVGFISGLGRMISATENILGANYKIPDIIQTDTPINPGNSGGVLLDSGGRLIGVTTAIATESGSSAGIGFAVPSAIVRQVVPSLISTSRYEHAWLGVSVLTLNPDLAEAMNLDAGQRGALIESVMADSPAAAAGLKSSEEQVTINGTTFGIGGDIIIAYNGQTVKSSDDVITFLSRDGAVGQTVTLTVIRDGQQIEVPVTLGARPIT